MLKSSLFAILFVGVSSAHAGWSGFYKAQFQDYSYFGKGRDDYQSSLNNLASIKNKGEHKSGVSYELSYDLAVFASKSAGIYDVDSTNSSRGYRLVDLETTPIDGENNSGERVDVIQNLNRFSLSYSGESYEIVAGRQAFGIGAGRTINPLDVWVPYNVTAIDTEELYGIDGIRAKLFFGTMGELEAAVFFQEREELRDLSVIVDTKFRALDYDFTILAAKYFQNMLIGFDFQGDLFDAGIWGEVAYNLMNDDKNYTRASAGGEYRLSSDITAFVEYHFNGAGAERKSEYLVASTGKGYSQGAVYFLGQNYLTVGGSNLLYPLFSLTGSYINSFTDGSGYLSLKGEYNFRENFYLDIGSFVGVSSGKSSEFSLYPDTLFSSIRYYF